MLTYINICSFSLASLRIYDHSFLRIQNFCVNRRWSRDGERMKITLPPQTIMSSTLHFELHMHTYGWNFSRCIFSPNIVTFFATLTAVFLHFLHWFYCFYYFYGSITCARVGKTKFLTRHLRLGTWKKPLNMDDFQVFSHFFPFCISSYKP